MVKTELTDREKAIAAANLFEGEGCVTLAKRGKDVYTRLALVMNDGDVVKKFHSWVGGNRPRKLHPPSWPAPQWSWQIVALDDVTRICGMLYPFLGKRRQEKIVDCLAADTRLG